MQKLIDLGCEVNAQDKDGMTALHKSYWLDNPDNFRLLLKNGADPEIEDNDEDSCNKLA